MKFLRDFFSGGERVKNARETIKALEKKSESGEKLNRREQKKLDEARQKTRRQILKLIVTGTAGVLTTLAGVKVLSEEKDAEKRKPKESIKSKSPESVEEPGIFPMATYTNIKLNPLPEMDPFRRMIELQKEWRKISLEALSKFQDDPRVAALMAFMEQNAFYSIPHGPVITQTIIEGGIEDARKQMNNPHAFEVVYMPEIYAQRMASAIQTEVGGKTIRIATNFKIQEWLGIMLAHELMHVKDQLIDGEDAKDPKQYLAGEVRAHLLENDLLKRWNPEGYKILIEKGIPMYKMRNISGIIDLVHKLYPMVEPEETSKETVLGQAGCYTAVVFEYARRQGVTDEGLSEVYKTLARK